MPGRQDLNLIARAHATALDAPGEDAAVIELVHILDGDAKRRRCLALAPLGISLVLFLLWVLYYATDWWSNPGQGGWPPANALFVLGWMLLLLAAVRPPKWWHDL